MFSSPRFEAFVRVLTLSAATIMAVIPSLLTSPLLTQAEEPSAPTISPSQEVTATLDQVVKINSEFSGKELTAERRKKLREIIQPRFDFDEMAKRSLGPEWQKRSEAERKEFVTIFSDLLATTYLSKIEIAKQGMIKIEKEKVENQKALVRTLVEHKGETFPIDYKLQLESGTWRVYDVIVENIGLVANYRNEFAGIIRKEQFSGLMERLREKSKKAEV